MSKVVLFDIDGTLCLTGGAGVRAMNRVCEEVLGNATRSTTYRSPAGPTGSSCGTHCERRPARWTTGTLDAFRARYVAVLREEIHHPGRGAKAVMPRRARTAGRRSSARDDVFLGLRDRKLRGRRANQARIFRSLGATSGAARLATTPRIGTRWCRSRCERAGRVRGRRRATEKSVRRWRHARMTSRARMPSAPRRSPWPRGAYR